MFTLEKVPFEAMLIILLLILAIVIISIIMLIVLAFHLVYNPEGFMQLRGLQDLCRRYNRRQKGSGGDKEEKLFSEAVDSGMISLENGKASVAIKMAERAKLVRPLIYHPALLLLVSNDTNDLHCNRARSKRSR